MFKVGDKVKYVGNNFTVNTILIPNKVYTVVGKCMDWVQQHDMLVLDGFNSMPDHSYSFDANMFTSADIDYFAITASLS